MRLFSSAVLLFFLISLTACTSDVESRVQPSGEKRAVYEQKSESSNLSYVFQTDFPTRTVAQSGKLGMVDYGLSEDDRLLYVKKTGAEWNLSYSKGRLVEIKGSKSIDFVREMSRLVRIDVGARNLEFIYDQAGRLVQVRGGPVPIYIEWDSFGNVRSVRRGASAGTEFTYDDNGRIKFIRRGGVSTRAFYDDKSRLRNLDTGESKLILGYWRDDKLISFSGKTFGQGLTVSYGPVYPPREAQIVHSEDDSKFSAAYTSTLYKVVDDYIYCKYARRLKSLEFEGLSFAIFRQYFGGDIVDYFAMNYACIPYVE
ncbi:hypothetical protein D6825_00115 [Candidatus Woesearchaeota archaeon]|nr:MAG: hypothetical protein D6825_00115 [Candidatus Woesearchaeota archaeon]